MLRFMAAAGRRWLRFSQILGNIQMSILLSLMYWTFLLIVALPYKFFNDRLALRSSGKARWIERTPGTDRLDSLRKQG